MSDAPEPVTVEALCPRCQGDLSRCIHTARYCPRCGAALGTCLSAPCPPVAELNGAADAEFSSELIDLREATLLPVEAPPPPVLPLPVLPVRACDDDAHSLMLTGYANAMFRLGWRYETAAGAVRNEHEAVRCYFKAAKLGNTDALARLAPPRGEEPDTPEAGDEPTPVPA